MNAGELRHKIIIQKRDNTNKWNDYYTCHAKVNIAGGNEYFGSGAEQSTSSIIFEVRYAKILADMLCHTQVYRILFSDCIFDVQDTDNYMFSNQSLKIKAVGRRGN